MDVDPGPTAVDELLAALDALPRVRLAALPTPLVEAPRLGASIGVRRMFVKRDDLTGLGAGGNKIRTLEYTVADALVAGADLFVGAAYVHSNHCRQLAAAGARLGVDVRLILRRRPDVALDWQGNLLLDDLFGATIEFVEAADVDELLMLAHRRMGELRVDGRQPALLTLGPRSKLLGAVAAMRTLLEIRAQLEAEGERRVHIYVASGGPTYTGLLAAARLIGFEGEIHGISNQLDRETHRAGLTELLPRLAGVIGLAIPDRPPAIDIDDRFLGPGYGLVSDAGLAAIRTAATLDGLVLDPIYTAKGMAGLIAHAGEGRLDRDDVVVFLHTGGVPALFTHADRFRPTSDGPSASQGSLAS